MAGAFPPKPQNARFASTSHNMVAKDAAKRGLKLWSEEGGAIFFILRGEHAVSSALTVATLPNLVSEVADSTSTMLRTRSSTRRCPCFQCVVAS